MIETLIQAIDQAADLRPDSRFVCHSADHPGVSTLADVVGDGRRFGSGLLGLGVGAGDCVGLMLPAWREWPVAAVGALYAGAAILPIVTIYREQELRFLLNQSKARVLLTPDTLRGVDFTAVVEAAAPIPALGHHIMTGPGFDDLLNQVERPSASSQDPDALAVLVYTSGTTAEPKGVMHTHRTMLAENAAQKAARSIEGRETVLSPWPPGHVAGALQMLRFLTEGVDLVAMDQWDAAAAARLVAEYDVTSTSGTPFHLMALLDAADAQGIGLESLQSYIIGAAPVPPALVERSIERGISVVHCYGSSEHPTVTMGHRDDPLEKCIHTEGRPMAGVELRFVDDDGQDVPHGVDGEIATRGPDLFTGYLDGERNTDAFLDDGWYLTGDIGRLDEDGYLLVTDRKKDIIIRGGENIASREVEDVMRRLPAVADVAAIGAPDARMGEVVEVVVELAPGQTLELEHIVQHFRSAGIARQKTPERLRIVEALPRNATGKVLKHTLRDKAG